jgi:TRAP-type transport system small permease protein
MLDSLINRYCKWLDYFAALALAVMVVLVFGNVVLRYGFNSGLSVSEELSRWLFVWVTFLGAVAALKDRAHLGTDMLVGRLGPFGKRICLALSYLLMLFCCYLLFKGALEQVKINWTSTSAAMEVSMAWFYASGMAFAVLGGLIIFRDLVRLLQGRVADSELQAFKASEEEAISYDDLEKTK